MVRRSATEDLFWFGLGIVTGIAALPWVRQLTERVGRALLELDEPAAARATPGDEPHPF